MTTDANTATAIATITTTATDATTSYYLHFPRIKHAIRN